MVKSYIFKPTFSETNLGTKVLDSKVMAAVLARFSRTGDGMERILSDLSTLDFNNSQKMVDRILKFIDYGHASIGGLTGGIAIGVDKISMLTPYLLFFLQAKQDGQETSTRYCEFKPEGLADPKTLGVPERFHMQWYEVMLEGFALSKEVCIELDRQVKAHPEIAKIPQGANDPMADRMRRNYGFDRSRYTLPTAALTNFGVFMTAREWADTIKYLSSAPLPEMKDWTNEIRTPLAEIMEQSMKHSYPTAMSSNYINNFFNRGAAYIQKNGINTTAIPDQVITSVTLPEENGIIDNDLSIEKRIDLAYEGKTNRYDIAKGYPEKIHVSAKWNNMAIAEARDINRQRPCHKDTLLAPVGFYMAPEMEQAIETLGLHDRYMQLQEKRAKLLVDLANSESPQSYVSALFLGDQTPFEIHTDAAHMTYILELRTGIGVHFRYDDHMRQAFHSFEKQCPKWTRHVTLGTGEPE